MQGEVVTILARAWSCMIFACVEGSATPSKPLQRQQLGFGRPGGGRSQGSIYLATALQFKLCISGGQAALILGRGPGNASEDGGPGTCISHPGKILIFSSPPNLCKPLWGR